MVVTMTAGQLYSLMEKAAENAATKAVEEILCHISTGRDGRSGDSDMLYGGEAIARALGVDRSTMYRLRRDGSLGDAVMQLGNGKLIARKSELLNAIKENKE